MSTPSIFGHRPEETPAPTVPGAPSRETAATFNTTGPAHTAGGRDRHRVARVMLLIAAGAMALAGAVTVVLRLGATVSVSPTLALALGALTALVATAIHLLGGRDEDGHRSVSGPVALSAVLVGGLLIAALYVWAVV